jgi:hypothetical protein
LTPLTYQAALHSLTGLDPSDPEQRAELIDLRSSLVGQGGLALPLAAHIDDLLERPACCWASSTTGMAHPYVREWVPTLVALLQAELPVLHLSEATNCVTKHLKDRLPERPGATDEPTEEERTP